MNRTDNFANIEHSGMPPSRVAGCRVLWTAMEVLSAADGPMPMQQVKDAIEGRMAFTPYELETYEKSKNVRWVALLQFFSIDFSKGGFLDKTKAGWVLTSEGQAFMDVNGPVRMFEEATERYREWSKTRPTKENPSSQLELQSARVWLISPGRRAKYWSYFVEESEISIGWDIGDLSQLGTRDEIQGQMEKVWNDGKNHNNIELALFEFAHVMKPGDVVIAKRGNKEYIGLGVVDSEYFYEQRPEPNPHPNIRRVEWIETGSWMEGDEHGDLVTKTLTDISKYPEYVERLEEKFGYDFDALSAHDSDKLDELREPRVEADKYGLHNLLKECFLEAKGVTPILTGLAAKKNIILQGPPGTGKTYIAKRLAYALMEEEAKDRVEVVQFHQSYSYEDFIQGFRPKENGGFERRDGVFFRFCEKAGRDPGRDYFFLIDEINRGNLSKIFGELMMLIEVDKRGESNRLQLTYSKEGEHFSIPENVHIIGTMNTADRSLAMVDYALRRRFAFFHMPPQFNDKFEAYLQEEHSISASMVKRIVSKLPTLNKTIEGDDNLGDGFEIGHSYFCTDVPKGTDEETWYAHIVDHEIGPQLLEYWFDDKAKAEAQIKLLKA